ncbi:YqgE/AlgH family protein [Nocardioidaceae bacterium]|nr:YqgE/AlgH family protein [Nocardioidaceae bacterium]
MATGTDPVTGFALAAGMLLLAGPSLTEATFRGSVVLLLDIDDEGALGVVLNRPTGAHLGEATPMADFDGFGPAAGAVRSTPVMEGGPVDRTRLLALVEWRPGWGPRGDRLQQVLPGTGMADLIGLAESGEGALDPAWESVRIRAYVGYAGWGPGQLQHEVAEGAWYVLPGEQEDPFSSAPQTLWRQVVARQPGRLSWLASRPADVGRN